MLPTTNARAKRRPSRSHSSFSWSTLIVGILGVLALLWVCVTLTLLPSRLGSSVDEATQAGIVGAAELAQQRRDNDQDLVTEAPGASTMTFEDVMTQLKGFLTELHTKYAKLNSGHTSVMKIWDEYRDTAERWLLPLDNSHNQKGLFPVRNDNSIFVSLASYRDENCPVTLQQLYAKADNPDNVFVGLVMQNCFDKCKTGVLEGGRVEDTVPDVHCYEEFCKSPEGLGRCADKNRVRLLPVEESESLGPAVARYLASKLWHGETYFMQIDSHSLFDQGWDTAFTEDILNTPTYPKSVLTNYPASADHPGFGGVAARICGAHFTTSSIEQQILRLDNSGAFEREVQKVPCHAPFVGAGFVFGHASFLAVMPFDPYVPWVFMGEEIQFSLRLYTWGYDMYSPTKNKVSHWYVRQHKPKFWESTNRLFNDPGAHNSLTELLIDRIKNLVGYPESSAEVIHPSLLCHQDLYGVGPERSVEEYMQVVGLDANEKKRYSIEWCGRCGEYESSMPKWWKL